MLDALVANDELSHAEIRDQVVTLIGAGYDTTAATLAWTFWCAASDPGTWAALRNEADRVVGPAERSVDHASPPRLVAFGHAGRVVRETLRLHPAGVIAPRETTRAITLDGVELKARTLVLWSAHLAGRDPDAWVDPLTWNPDRHLTNDDTQRALTAAAWVPFGGGARSCIGFALAEMVLTLVISRVAQRLDVELDATKKPQPIGMVVNRPSGGVPATIRSRHG